MRQALLEHLTAQGCRCIKRRGRAPIWENAAGTKRASFPRRPELRAEDVRRVCQRLGIPIPAWLWELLGDEAEQSTPADSPRE
jgi:hypothetical protein